MSAAQAQRILDRLERHKRMFDFTADGLGEKLLNVASLNCWLSLMNQEDAQGNALAPLSEDYAEWKAKAKPGYPIGVLEFEMAKREHFFGERDVKPDEAEVVYGKNDKAREEAAWFIEGDPSNNRPPRPFWGLTAQAIKESEEILAARLRDVL